MRVLAGLLLVAAPSGCAGNALVQTAKTTAPGSTRGAISEVLVKNDRGGDGSDTGSTAETRSWKFVGMQIDYRVGVTDHADLGIGSFLVGLRTDVKVDLAEPSQRWGIAPRAGIGIGKDFAVGNVAAPFAGVLASWEPWRVLSVYGGITFTNYWISQAERPEWASNHPGTREASSNGWGDGVLQCSAGLAFAPRGPASIYLEYGFLEPLQDNPADYYRFVRSHLAVAGFTF